MNLGNPMQLLMPSMLSPQLPMRFILVGCMENNYHLPVNKGIGKCLTGRVVTLRCAVTMPSSATRYMWHTNGIPVQRVEIWKINLISSVTSSFPSLTCLNFQSCRHSIYQRRNVWGPHITTILLAEPARWLAAEPRPEECTFKPSNSVFSKKKT